MQPCVTLAKTSGIATELRLRWGHHLSPWSQTEVRLWASLAHLCMWVCACVHACSTVTWWEHVFYQLLPLVWTESWWKPGQTLGNVSRGVKSTDGALTALGTPLRGAMPSVTVAAYWAALCQPAALQRRRFKQVKGHYNPAQTVSGRGKQEGDQNNTQKCCPASEEQL